MTHHVDSCDRQIILILVYYPLTLTRSEKFLYTASPPDLFFQHCNKQLSVPRFRFTQILKWVACFCLKFNVALSFVTERSMWILTRRNGSIVTRRNEWIVTRRSQWILTHRNQLIVTRRTQWILTRRSQWIVTRRSDCIHYFAKFETSIW